MKKLFAFGLAMILFMSAFSPAIFATDLGDRYIYTTESGTEIYYYLDECGII